MIKRIIIHKTLIDSFKRCSLKVMPKEHIVALLGKLSQNGESLYVHAFSEVDVFSNKSTKNFLYLQYYRPEEEMEDETDLKYFGTLHSHPRGSTEPSFMDMKDFRKNFNNDVEIYDDCVVEYLADEIMGIMRVGKKKNVIQHAITFYNIDMKPIELYISETKVKKNEKN